ncbi:hypothetical protein HCCG_01347 [Helicobacter cinaedi CCUG 18818 = ATCC BAA-847]|uniref:Uncharacterized protein n=1 Tax=Helicobacter cinaedi CCUG 18818 = ATCC BAA-847 TaxID=537971 RepID=A0ABN0BB21_9HELI|nr:hypothetical protein HCCG_01347 [Helicobacter cinaedi CCUG 18818 = ATCC BAA-847]
MQFCSTILLEFAQKEKSWNVLIANTHSPIAKWFHCLKALIKQRKIVKSAISHLSVAKVPKPAQVRVAQKHTESANPPRFTDILKNSH